MRYPHEDRSAKEAAYRTARYGVAGAYLMPSVDRGLDRFSERFNAKLVVVILGALFLAFLFTGKMNVSHRETLVAEGRFSEEPTGRYSHRYAIGGYERRNGSTRWVGEDHRMFVTPGDAFAHRLWKSLRTVSGWMLLVALAVAGIGWWRRSQRRLAAEAFGSGTAEYDEYLFERSAEGHHQREYRNDWLVNDVPRAEDGGFRHGGERPRFGRKTTGQ